MENNQIAANFANYLTFKPTLINNEENNYQMQNIYLLSTHITSNREIEMIEKVYQRKCYSEKVSYKLSV